MCARRRTHLLLRRQKKVGQEKATPSLRPPFALSGERGQPAMLGSGVVPQNLYGRLPCGKRVLEFLTWRVHCVLISGL